MLRNLSASFDNEEKIVLLKDTLEKLTYICCSPRNGAINVSGKLTLMSPVAS